MNTQDAKAHALEEGDEISVSSNKGKIALPVKVTDDIKQGIVSIPHGWGHVFDDMQLSIAKQHAGVNINNLMDTTQIDALSGNAVLSMNWV